MNKIESNLNDFDIEKILAKVERAVELATKKAYKRIDDDLDSWISRGKEVIDVEKHEEWERCVRSLTNKKCCTDSTVINHVTSLDVAIDVLSQLKGECLIKVVDEFTCASYPISVLEMVRNLIMRFSEVGPSFYAFTSFEELSDEERIEIEGFQRHNNDLKRLDLTDKNQLT